MLLVLRLLTEGGQGTVRSECLVDRLDKLERRQVVPVPLGQRHVLAGVADQLAQFWLAQARSESTIPDLPSQPRRDTVATRR
ncbi:hypothetical protein ADK67_32575 [Saccharothrix sp. NRRL B-16348]|nr:hypothetical protein ADK67_32575 [Saccharothrix sp. NRRL B-16348]